MIGINQIRRKRKVKGGNKMVVKWFKIKKGKMTKISTPKNIGSYLDRGYTLTKATTVGKKTKINSDTTNKT